MDKKVSIYKNVFDSKGGIGNLFSFLTTDRWKDDSIRVRNEKNEEKRKQIKLQLPACTPSGLFENKTTLIQHSGLICIDIDGKDNPKITNYNSFIEELGNLQEVAFAGKSVSGNGAFAIIPIKYPDRHVDHFRALEEDFLRHGIVIDHLCKNPNRLRTYSYNDKPYINHDAKVYRRCFQPIKRQTHAYLGDNDIVDQYARKVIERGLIIAPTYSTWFELAASLASVPNGRELFHAISSLDTHKYNFKEAEKQFNSVKASGGIGAGTFIHLCKQQLN